MATASCSTPRPGKSPRRWKNVKQALRFCRVTQDGDDEGILRLDRLPTPDEAVLIRAELGIRKRRHLSAETVAAMTARLPQARDKTTVPDPGLAEPTEPVLEAIVGTLAIVEPADGGGCRPHM